MTDSARELMRTCKEQVSVQNQRLIFQRKKDTRQAETCVEWLLGNSHTSGSGYTFLVERTQPQQPLIVSAFPLPPQSPPVALDAPAAGILVILRDPDHQLAVQWQVFARQFRLTTAELRLCVAWANGLTLSEYSEKFHISTHTARSQMKSIFNKTGTHSQIQLLRLIFAFVHL